MESVGESQVEHGLRWAKSSANDGQNPGCSRIPPTAVSTFSFDPTTARTATTRERYWPEIGHCGVGLAARTPSRLWVFTSSLLPQKPQSQGQGVSRWPCRTTAQSRTGCASSEPNAVAVDNSLDRRVWGHEDLPLLTTGDRQYGRLAVVRESISQSWNLSRRVDSQAPVLTVLLSIFASDQGVKDRQYRLDRQILKSVSGLECAK